MDISWAASSDDVGVVAYDIYRDVGFLDSVGQVTTYQDNTVLPESAYLYLVCARDTAGNVSTPSNPADVITPAQPGEFFSVADFSWSEDSVTYLNAPVAGPSLGSFGSVSPGAWHELDLTAALNAALSNGDPYFALRITSPDANGADYASKENSNGFAPELVILLQ